MYKPSVCYIRVRSNEVLLYITAVNIVITHIPFANNSTDKCQGQPNWYRGGAKTAMSDQGTAHAHCVISQGITCHHVLYQHRLGPSYGHHLTYPSPKVHSINRPNEILITPDSVA